MRLRCPNPAESHLCYPWYAGDARTDRLALKAGVRMVYGVELNADIGYESDTFAIGLAYGVLFPLSAMDHPQPASSDTEPNLPFSQNSGDAGTAQTLQTRFVLKF